MAHAPRKRVSEQDKTTTAFNVAGARPVLPLGPQVEQLDLLRRHTGLVGETLDDSAGRHKMRVGVGRKRDGETTYLTRRS